MPFDPMLHRGTAQHRDDGRLAGVLVDVLADRRGARAAIEQIVEKLEGVAELGGKAAQMRAGRLAGTRRDRADLDGGQEQRAGLAAVGRRDLVERPFGAAAAQIGELATDEAFDADGAGQHRHRLEPRSGRQALHPGEHLIGTGQDGDRRQDGDILAVGDMGGRSATTHRGVVHAGQIVEN